MSGFDPSAPFEVVEEDCEYARPDGTPLLARIYRPAGADRGIARMRDFIARQLVPR